MDRISIVVPCFNEEEALPVYYREMKRVMGELSEVSFEILFVDDGSSDKTLEILKQLNAKDGRCEYLSFSRNFGKEAAIYAGLKHASGDYVATMDVDLQDPPGLLPEEIVNGARDYRLMKRIMVDAVLEMSEYNRFSKGIFGWVGFRTKWLEFQNVERSAGETKWSLRKLFSYSLEGITGFSVAPLSLASVMGVGFCVLAFIMIAVIIVRTLIWGDPVAGWPSMVCIIFLVSGVQLFCLGIVGEYLAKTYLETKHRPIFILKESKVQTAGKVAGDSFVGSGVNAVMREKKSGEESHEDKTVKAFA